MTLTPERIAEIEAAFGEETLMAVIDFADVAELCRLARLGLKVEGAPTTVCAEWTEVIGRPPFDSYKMVGRCPCPLEMAGKRVALVVLEDSK